MFKQEHKHYYKVKDALELIVKNSKNNQEMMTLKNLANTMAMSEHHFHRVFSEWAGISPLKFQQYIIKNTAKDLLHQYSVSDTALELGLSSSSRLYDLMVTCEGITPGEYKTLGKDINIDYGWGESPFGYCFIGKTKRGICKLAFFDDKAQEIELVEETQEEWPLANLTKNQKAIEAIIKNIFNSDKTKPDQLHLLLKGTPFQLKVWEALLKIPEGNILSYGQLAKSIDNDKAVRAVSSAVASNPIGYLIPCHRVIRQCGAINQYRWGTTRKQALLFKEIAEKKEMIN